MTRGPDSGSLFEGLARRGAEEMLDELHAAAGARIERIVSHGHASPAGFWYDEAEDEWVVVICGSAQLRIEGEARARHLTAGDWVFLPAHCRHRVERTARNEPTIWLAVHLTATAHGSSNS